MGSATFQNIPDHILYHLQEKKELSDLSLGHLVKCYRVMLKNYYPHASTCKSIITSILILLFKMEHHRGNL